MLVKGFKIVAPKRFEVYIEDVSGNNGEALVRIERAAVCKADLRYFHGNRDKRVLGLKYPMNLLHEGQGIIIKDKTKTFKHGERVVLVPNILLEEHLRVYQQTRISGDTKLGENYFPKAKFASSNWNGFSRNILSYPVSNIVRISEKINSNVSVFSELISVVCAAIRRIDLEDNHVVGIWGDGILGYILCCVLKFLTNCKVIVIGRHREKLASFPADDVRLANSIGTKLDDIDVAFECVGGQGAEYAINEIIDTILPGGKIVLTGVSENIVGINTRKVLEKGLELYGTTRSHVGDFIQAVELLENKEFSNYIEKLILSTNKINDISDFYRIFEMEANNKELGKNIMVYNF